MMKLELYNLSDGRWAVSHDGRVIFVGSQEACGDLIRVYAAKRDERQHQDKMASRAIGL